MREVMDAWTFVIASYVVGVGAAAVMIAWSLLSMKRAEKRRDEAQGKR
ncbi:hypothetical protein GCM10011494_11120 [Novosphingobium endophyticum]|uniref:Heme exporter protein D n=1 Tax=Novosphingobium endophyticum TaxID=1955250 RepID=A0A916TR34_9SPHN|nr:hypothetical protein [Novosphingobium endophyticum]GGB94438.1 hypothetical protein GCM10011494_11120 [Novosphingobium endophyticum]